MKKCEKCGQQYNDKMKFCVVDGTELIDAETAPAETVPEEVITEEFPPIEETPEEVETEEPAPQEVIADEPAADEPAAEETVTEEPITEETFSAEDELPIKEAKPKVTVGRVVRGIFAAVFGVVCFAVLTFAGLSYTLRYFSYGESIESIVTSIDILNLPLHNTPMEDAGDTVLEAVYASSDGMGLSKEDIEDIYEDATFRDELINIISMYTDFFRTGEYSTALTTDMIKGIYEDNLDVINRVLERAGEPPVNEYDRALALASIETAEETLERISFENLNESDELINPMVLLRIGLSLEAIIGELAFALIIMLIIGLISKSVRTPLFIGGLSLLLSGGAIGITLYLIESMAIETVGNNALQTIIAGAAKFLGGQMYIICAGAAAVGIVMMILSSIKIKRKA
ncbi:MAG: hypothetical protein LBL98_04410 [Ruminococcus sp.]|jgi:hypothetical protein|nr:hypothetical protein [Ruminococcus sp.]